jgi:predicted Rossmann fold flavoprotein
MAAIWAAGDAGVEVLVLERKPEPGRKILISGGGRCNVLPSSTGEALFRTASSRHAFGKVFRSWPLGEQRRFFEETLGVPLKLEEESGKLFPVSDRASDVRKALLEEARRRGARLRTGASVEDISREAAGFGLTLADGAKLVADRVILASGGLSIPGSGSDGTGIRIAARLGHTTSPLYPALTPLLTNRASHHALSGVSLPVTLFAPRDGSLAKGESARGGFLFTHRGYSGPAVLDLSHLAVVAGRPASQPLLVQWSGLDADAWSEVLRSGAGRPASGATRIRTLLRERLPERLADLLLAETGTGERTIATLKRDERRTLVEFLARYPLPYTGNEGYARAEVTGGGIPLGEVDPGTLESRIVPGLFLSGEMLDAFGPIGGHNFVWAWVTGRLAGLGAARKGPETGT